MMPTEDIPSDAWQGFFDRFSRQHEGWWVNMEIIGGEVGAAREADEIRLAGISADVKERSGAIVILLHSSGTGHITHIIPKPRSVRLKRTADGADEALDIESADGVKTLVRFRTAQPAELLDGVMG